MTMKRLLIVLFVLFSCTLVKAQTRKITGKVSSTANPALEGATVQVKGTSLSTTTDAGGRFAISVPEGTTALIFSYVGFQAMEVDITRTSMVEVTLKERANEM